MNINFKKIYNVWYSKRMQKLLVTLCGTRLSNFFGPSCLMFTDGNVYFHYYFFLNSMISQFNQISHILFYKSHRFGFEFCLFYISFLLGGTKAMKENVLVHEIWFMVAFIFSNYTREDNLVSLTCKHLCLGQLFEGGLRWHFIWGEISQAYIQLNFQSCSAVDDMAIDRTDNF